MAHDDRPAGEPLRASRADVVLAEHLEEARPGEAGDEGRGDGAEGHGGQHEVSQVPAAGGGEPAEVEREDDDQEEAEPEARHRDAEEGEEHGAQVHPGSREQRGGVVRHPVVDLRLRRRHQLAVAQQLGEHHVTHAEAERGQVHAA